MAGTLASPFGWRYCYPALVNPEGKKVLIRFASTVCGIAFIMVVPRRLVDDPDPAGRLARIRRARAILEDVYDRRYGGMPPDLERLLDEIEKDGEAETP